MPTPGPLELVIILVIALLILGPGKLPEVGSALGKSIREFRKASSDVQDAVKVNVDTTPLPNVLNTQAAPNTTAPVEPATPSANPTYTQAEVEARIAAAVAAAKAETASTATPPAAGPTTSAQ
ncbi:MAG TPA: twin-arginine translocase TatA/TatE family subunit [Frankiaceae bacterium]|nr:twin-arginine translocase TatA/TatE family subunit [Frankiaceae bacterium]